MKNKLIKASIWAKSQFANNSIPHRITLKRWIEKGKIRGLVDDSGALWVFENQIFGVDESISSEVTEMMKESV